jgi:DUF4097 and DUF4098 domain-containing protein YvlB
VNHRTLSRLIAPVIAALLLAAVPAAAQETTIRIRIPDEITHELRHVATAMDALQQHLGRDIREAVHLSIGELRHLTRLHGLETLGNLSAVVDIRQTRNFREEEIDRATRQFDLGTSGVLELRNVSGDITVTAGSGAEATVEIVRRSRGRTAADARRGLDEVTADVAEQRGRASVIARYPDNQNRAPYSVSISYVVRAPAGTRVTVGIVAGDVTVKGITGDLAVDLISGDIDISDAARVQQVKTVSGDITLTNVQTDASLGIGSINGDVTLRRIRAGQLTVTGVSDDVDASDVTVGGADLKTISGTVRYTGGLQGKGRYEFQTHSGDVVLELANAASFELEARTFSGDIRPEPSLAANLAAGRRSLRGRVGNGDAVVVATTFSGDVVIRRR